MNLIRVNIPAGRGKIALVGLAIMFSLPACTTMNGANVLPSFIGDGNEDFQKNVYANVGIGTSRLTPDVSNFPALDVNDRVEPAGQITVGADLTKTFSVEVHSADLGSAGFSPSSGADGSSSAGRYNYHMAGASALVYAGKNRGNDGRQGLTGFGRLGVVAVDNSVVNNANLNYERESGSGILVGAGVEYATKMGVGLRAEVMATDSDIQYGQIGINYRLGVGGKRPVLAAAKPDVEELPYVSPPPPPPPPAPVLAAAKAPKDSDGDGVFNGSDNCPSSSAGAIVDVYGCEAFGDLMDIVRFDSDSDELTSAAQKKLNDIADELQDYPAARLQLLAHTDSNGSEDYNRQLSQRRATAVAKYLTKRGVKGGLVSARAEGELAPTDNNATPAGRRNNRRVELYANEVVRSPWSEKRIAQ